MPSHPRRCRAPSACSKSVITARYGSKSIMKRHIVSQPPVSLFRSALLVVAMSDIASAASSDVHPRFGPILFSLAILVFSAKVGGLLAERWRQPPVLGELLAGIALGNLLPLFFGAE